MFLVAKVGRKERKCLYLRIINTKITDMKKVFTFLCLFVVAFAVQARAAVSEAEKEAILDAFNEMMPMQIDDDLVWTKVDFAPDGYLRFTFVTSDPDLSEATSYALKNAEQAFREEIVNGFCNDPDTSSLIRTLGTGLRVILKGDNDRQLYDIRMPASQFK